VTTVMIVDDQELILTALGSVLGSDPELRTQGQFKSAEEALEAIAISAPDVLLTDLEMPGIGGLELIRIVGESFPNTKVLALTTFETSENMKSALSFGASGFLSKGSTALDIVAAVKLVASGEVVISPRTKHWLQQALNGSDSKSQSILSLGLTPREIEVLKLVSIGLSNADIAQELFISPLTAKTHVARLFGKLGVSNRAALVAKAKDFDLGNS
jgi:DNA-binding NarL/FixJ family response regulator